MGVCTVITHMIYLMGFFAILDTLRENFKNRLAQVASIITDYRLVPQLSGFYQPD